MRYSKKINSHKAKEAEIEEIIYQATQAGAAEEKLNDTMETTPVRIREPQSFSAETEPEEIPDIPDEELDDWIADLTEQNANIQEQLDLLTGSRDALKERYGVTEE